jgi:hypothetical protein
MSNRPALTKSVATNHLPVGTFLRNAAPSAPPPVVRRLKEAVMRRALKSVRPAAKAANRVLTGGPILARALPAAIAGM